MPESFDLVEALRADGVPAVISGAGPTVLAFANGPSAPGTADLLPGARTAGRPFTSPSTRTASASTEGGRDSGSRWYIGAAPESRRTPPFTIVRISSAHPPHAPHGSAAQGASVQQPAARIDPPGPDTWEGPHVTETIEPTTAKKRGGGLNSMLLADLRQMARGMGISGTASMKKAQLVEAIKAAQAGGKARKSDAEGSDSPADAGQSEARSPTSPSSRSSPSRPRSRKEPQGSRQDSKDSKDSKDQGLQGRPPLRRAEAGPRRRPRGGPDSDRDSDRKDGPDGNQNRNQNRTPRRPGRARAPRARAQPQPPPPWPRPQPPGR